MYLRSPVSPPIENCAQQDQHCVPSSFFDDREGYVELMEREGSDFILGYQNLWILLKVGLDSSGGSGKSSIGCGPAVSLRIKSSQCSQRSGGQPETARVMSHDDLMICSEVLNLNSGQYRSDITGLSILCLNRDK